jgi:mannobiose 2-epimerase
MKPIALSPASAVELPVEFRLELRRELSSILQWWSSVAVDQTRGGFFGAVDNNNVPDPEAPKGMVMMARICWAFSEAYRFHPREEWRQMAERAFSWMLHQGWDHEYGGFFWSLTPEGEMWDGKKQVYGQAFGLYALAAYYRISGDGMALHLARDLFRYIEQNSADTEHGGYWEAFDRDWSPIADMRLSDKDANESKTANTHLHIVEAYALLYRVAPDEELRERIVHLLELFDQHFIRPDGSLQLFFNDNWEPRGTLRSFGHEIESAWLLKDCAEAIDDRRLIDCFTQHARRLIAAAEIGWDADGGLWYEWEPDSDTWIREKHSWPQAEALLAYICQWQETGNREWLEKAKHSWKFIREHLLDKQKGEWFWGVDEEYKVMNKDKAGFWKCPYHNSRAILESLWRMASF